MNKLIVREGARRVDTVFDESEDAPVYSPEVVMSWPELGLTLICAAFTAVLAVWFFAANWPNLVAALSFWSVK